MAQPQHSTHPSSSLVVPRHSPDLHQGGFKITGAIDQSRYMTNPANNYQNYQQPPSAGMHTQSHPYVTAQTGPGQQLSYSPLSSSSDRTAAVLGHLAGPIATLVSAGSLAILGPLIIYLVYKDRSPFVRQQAAEAFNFQLTMWIAAIVGFILCLTVIALPFGVLMMIAASVMSVIMGIIASLKTAGEGGYDYPWKFNILR